jgi:hypothetical protein
MREASILRMLYTNPYVVKLYRAYRNIFGVRILLMEYIPFQFFVPSTAQEFNDYVFQCLKVITFLLIIIYI